MFPFGPAIESFISKQCFIPKEPIEMCRHAWSSKMPAIFTACSGEGLLLYRSIIIDFIKYNQFFFNSINFLVTKKKSSLLSKIADNFEALVPFDVEPNRTSIQCKELGQVYKKFYFGYTEPSLANIDTYIQVS